MALLADENVARPIIARLRLDGHDVRAIAEMRTGIPDTDVLAVADRGGFLLITQDRDFGELAIMRAMPVRGVVLLELERLPLAMQVERVSSVLGADLSPLFGRLTVIEPTRTRARQPPRS